MDATAELVGAMHVGRGVTGAVLEDAAQTRSAAGRGMAVATGVRRGVSMYGSLPARDGPAVGVVQWTRPVTGLRGLRGSFASDGGGVDGGLVYSDSNGMLSDSIPSSSFIRVMSVSV